MPSHLKDHIRARMEKTGESYQQAVRHVRAQEERAPWAPSTSAGDEKVVRSRTVADTAFWNAVVRDEEGRRPDSERCGFASCEDVAGDDLWRRYPPGEPHPNAWLTKVGLATV